MKAKWSVLAVYENADGRQLAVEFCDGLVQRFWSQHGFEISWCKCAELQELASSKEYTQKARQADLIVVAPGRPGTIPDLMERWLELALKDRSDREGVLVGLAGTASETSAACMATQSLLRKMAHVAGMDYLTAVPDCLPTDALDSPDACNQRATQVTSVLDNILSYSPLPPAAL